MPGYGPLTSGRGPPPFCSHSCHIGSWPSFPRLDAVVCLASFSVFRTPPRRLARPACRRDLEQAPPSLGTFTVLPGLGGSPQPHFDLPFLTESAPIGTVFFHPFHTFKCGTRAEQGQDRALAAGPGTRCGDVPRFGSQAEKGAS